MLVSFLHSLVFCGHEIAIAFTVLASLYYNCEYFCSVWVIAYFWTNHCGQSKGSVLIVLRLCRLFYQNNTDERVCMCLFGWDVGGNRGQGGNRPPEGHWGAQRLLTGFLMAKSVRVYHTVFLTLKRSLVELELAHACWEGPFISVESGFFFSKIKWLVSWHLKLYPNLHCSIWWTSKSLIFKKKSES